MLTHLVLLFKYILELRQIQSLIWRNIFCNHDHHENYLLKGFWQLGDLDDRGLPQRPTSFLQNDDVDDDNGNDDNGGDYNNDDNNCNDDAGVNAGNADDSDHGNRSFHGSVSLYVHCSVNLICRVLGETIQTRIIEVIQCHIRRVHILVYLYLHCFQR